MTWYYLTLGIKRVPKPSNAITSCNHPLVALCPSFLWLKLFSLLLSATLVSSAVATTSLTPSQPRASGFATTTAPARFDLNELSSLGLAKFCLLTGNLSLWLVSFVSSYEEVSVLKSWRQIRRCSSYSVMFYRFGSQWLFFHLSHRSSC